MEIDTLRFGPLQVDEKKLLRFKSGLPGLEDCAEFAILQFEESNPLHWLQSTQRPEVCLPIINAFAICPGYAFDISDEDVEELALNGPEDVYVVSVVLIPERDIEQMTANLVAPIIINHRSGSAKQIIINSGEYNVRFPVFQTICNLIKEDEADAGALPQDK
ncbi:MAG: flagellar assembly protein FliW [Clostridiales bacterium]|nr:flagellar assembly protein FliW [Clostridiales bacterium]